MLKKTIAIIILIIGLLLIFSPFIKNGIVKYMSGHETIEQYKASDIKKIMKKTLHLILKVFSYLL